MVERTPRRSRGGQQRVGQRHREGQVLGPELLGRVWSPGAAAKPRRWRLCNAKRWAYRAFPLRKTSISDVTKKHMAWSGSGHCQRCPDTRLDFSKFLAEYEACHMNYVRMKFAEALLFCQTSQDPNKAKMLRGIGVQNVGNRWSLLFYWHLLATLIDSMNWLVFSCKKNAVSIKPQCFLGGQPTVDHRVEHDDTRRDHGPTIIPYLDQCGWTNLLYHMYNITMYNIHILLYLYYIIKVYFIYIYLVGGLEHELYDFPFSWECHHPNWRTHSIIFQRGRAQPPTRKGY